MGSHVNAPVAPLPGLTAEGLRNSLDHLSAFLQGVADGILVQGRDGAVLFVNDAGARLCGFDSVAAMRATPIARVLDKFALFDEAGQPFSTTDLPAQRVLHGLPAPEIVLRTRVRGSCGERWSAVSATPVRDAEGAVQFAISVFRDITERRRAGFAARFLADAGAILAASLDYETTVRQVAQLAVPRVADWCAVDIADVDGRPHLLALAHIDPAKVTLGHEHRRRYPVDPDAPFGVPEVIRSGRSQLVSEIPDALLISWARDAEHLAMLRALGIASMMLVPLVARGRVLGAMNFVSSSHERLFDPADLAFAESLAARAGLAIDNARLYRDAVAAEERYHGLFGGVGDAVLVTDAEGNCIDANPAMTALVGYSVEELRRLRESDLTVTETGIAREIHRLPDDSVRRELILRCKGGATVPVEGLTTSLAAPSGVLHIGAWRDISERRHVEEERQRFVAMVEHELRNPLTAIVVYAQLMRQRARYDAKAVDSIIAQAKQIERLTLDLREAMRARAGVLTLQRSAVDVRALIAAVVEQVQATTTDHTISLAMPTHLHPAEWDADRVGEVLGNLLLNAIKYSPSGGDVRVVVEEIGESVRVSVADFGLGIPQHSLPRIFEPFYRATNATEGSARGMGLGLSIAKELVVAHGGEMTVESVLGRGSTFAFALPYAPPS
jgi:PAS domain S-box-containing protein